LLSGTATSMVDSIAYAVEGRLLGPRIEYR
jgi:hypothetical protein